MGIGVIPNAVLTCLTSHKDLGIHKKKHPGKIVSGFAMGTRKLYDFIDDNPEVSMLDISYINDPHVIRKNPKVTAIEVDLTGQVCADTIGTKQYSDVGGQMDFIRGASLSEDQSSHFLLPRPKENPESFLY